MNVEIPLELRRLAVARSRAGVRVRGGARSPARSPAAPATHRRPASPRRSVSTRTARRRPSPPPPGSVAAGERLRAARGHQQPRRRRARRVRDRRGALVGGARPSTGARWTPSTWAVASAWTTPATPVRPRRPGRGAGPVQPDLPAGPAWCWNRAGFWRRAGGYAARCSTVSAPTAAVRRAAGGTNHFRLPAAWGYSHPFAVLPVDEWPHRTCGPRCPAWRWTRRRTSAHHATCSRGHRPWSVCASGTFLVFRGGRVRLGNLPSRFLRHDPPEFLHR